MGPPGHRRARSADDSRRRHRVARRRLALHPDRRGRHRSRRRRRDSGRHQLLLHARGAEREGGRHRVAPRLSREALHNKLVEFRETYDLGVSWSWFVAVPASLTLLVSASRSRRRSRSARCANHHGIALLSAAIAGFGLALIFATMYEFAKQACYARHDVRAPLIGCAVMVALLLVGSPIATAALDGPGLLFGLGLLVTLGELIRAFIVDRRRAPRDACARAVASTRSHGTSASR